MSDLRPLAGWLELAADLVALEPACWPAERIARQLTDTFLAASCTFHSREPDGSGGSGALQSGRAPESRFELRTAAPAQWNLDAHVEPSHLVLPLLNESDVQQVFIIWRPTPFSPEELELARKLHRLLNALSRVAADCRAPNCEGQVPTGASEGGRLTPRELAVLALLADGLTAASIGRKLTIAERTVHKHLERIYAKLGVADRLSAVLRAQHASLLPVPLRRHEAPRTWA